MIVPKTAKVEKAASKDKTRPVLTALHLNTNTDTATGKVTATLEATDSYMLVRVPVTLEDGDVPGLVPASALVEARKSADRLSGDVTLSVNGDVSYRTKDGAEVHAPRPEGQFPRADELFPVELSTFEIGVNPHLLAAAAEAMGCETIRLTFGKKRDYNQNMDQHDADPLRPMVVRPLGGRGAVHGSDAIVMPVRIAS
jgi:hypothetical protein